MSITVAEKRILTAICVAALAASAAFGAATARPLIPAERRYSPYNNNVPACDDPAVFERIQGRFHDREAEFGIRASKSWASRRLRKSATNQMVKISFRAATASRRLT